MSANDMVDSVLIASFLIFAFLFVASAIESVRYLSLLAAENINHRVIFIVAAIASLLFVYRFIS